MTVPKPSMICPSGDPKDINEIRILLGDVNQSNCPFILLTADELGPGTPNHPTLYAIEPQRGLASTGPGVLAINTHGVVGRGLSVPDRRGGAPPAELDWRGTQNPEGGRGPWQ